MKEIGRFGERVGKEIGRAGEKVIDVVKRPLKEVGRFGTRVGKEIGRVFRRWGSKCRFTLDVEFTRLASVHRYDMI